MPFGNISTLHIPRSALAGASQWGSDVRKLLDAAGGGSEFTTETNHSTGGAVIRTVDPYTSSVADGTEANFGFAVTPSDMNSVAGALRFYPAGNHTASFLMAHTTSVPPAATGTLTMYVYRVGPAAGRTRTLLGSGTASIAVPALGAGVTASVTVALAEVIFAADETIQYSFEFSIAGVAVTGRLIGYAFPYDDGTTAVPAKIVTPRLGVLADTTGTATGTGTAAGVTGQVLETLGTATGTGVAAGVGASRAETTGTAVGSGVASGLVSSVAGTTGTATGAGTAAGLASKVLGTTGMVEIGGGGTTIINRRVFVFDD